MSTLTENVSLTIRVDTVGIARAGFGTAMFLSYLPTWSERTRVYESEADVASDFATGTPELIAATQYFSQAPHPQQLIIARGALPPTQVYAIAVSTVTNNRVYAIDVSGPGITTGTATYTSDSSATNDEIANGLITALNGITGATYSAATAGSMGSYTITVTGNSTGTWFSLTVEDVTALSISQTHSDPGVATDLTDIQTVDDSWYALVTFFNSKLYVLAAAAWIEAQSKLYFPDVNDTKAITTAVTNGDTLDALHTLAYNRTAGSYYPTPSTFFSASWLGRVLPDDPGSETWDDKQLVGVAVTNLTATHRTNLRARKANFYVSIGGVGATQDGTIAGGSYGFIDVTRGLDWLENDMTIGVMNALLANEKIPYTNAGIAVIRNEIKASLKRAARAGIIGDDFTIDTPDISAIADSDKALRNLPGIEWSATLQGAIHKVIINGVVSL